ncbi:MAG: flagellar biosynthesis anti-sigma factor FlgM [Candidatus Poribacteria bacterium]
MKIFNYYDSLRIDKTYLRQSRSVDQKKSVSDTTKTKKTDELVLSSHISEMQKYEDIVKNLPDIQEEKSNAIGKQIESGKYKIDGKSVAKSIIDLIG